jgi:outer membrane protein, multidrug efflux system
LRRDKLAAEFAARSKAPDRARILYEKGVESFLPVLDAGRSLYATENALAQIERDRALGLIALYKSLGGGWQAASSGIS